MVPNRQKVRTDGQTEWTDGRTDGRTHGRRQNYIPPTSSGDNKKCSFYGKFTRHSRKRVFSYNINAPFKNAAIILCTRVNKLVTSDVQLCFPAPYFNLHAKYSHMPSCLEAAVAPVSPKHAGCIAIDIFVVLGNE